MRDRFVATANQSPELSLTVFWRDLDRAFDISNTQRNRGVRDAQAGQFSFYEPSSFFLYNHRIMR